MRLTIGTRGVDFHLGLVGAIVLGLILLIQFLRLTHNTSLVVQNVDFNFAGLGTVTIIQDRNAVQLAHKAWVQLATRKAEIPFDPNHDVIVEIYDSWYALFGELRKIVEEASPPVNSRHDDTTTLLINSIVGTLNVGLRPHLTEWQAKFRRWYDQQITYKPNLNKSPQEIQRLYPFYKELEQNLLLTNHGLAKYASELKRISQGNDGDSITKKLYKKLGSRAK